MLSSHQAAAWKLGRRDSAHLRLADKAGGDPMQTSQLRERHALEAALDALRALRTVTRLRTSRPQAAVNDRRTWLA